MDRPPLVGYCLTAPGGFWQCVRTMPQVGVLREDHPERTAHALVTEFDHRGAMQALRAEHAAQLAEAGTMIDALVAELAALKVERLGSIGSQKHPAD